MIDRRKTPAINLRIITFLYHEVGDSGSGYQRPAALPYKHSREEFRSNLNTIAQLGRISRRVDQIDFTQAGDYLLMTFDDGGRSAMIAAEELEARGWKGHFFVVTDQIGTAGFLDASSIRRLHDAGHVIGSHSKSHPDIFRTLSREQMLYEWQQSLRRIEDITGTSCVSASVPGGDISSRVLESAKDAGVRFLFTSEPILKPHSLKDLRVLGRVCPKAGTSRKRIHRMAAAAWQPEQLLRQLKNSARVLFAPAYRVYVRRITGG